MGGTHTSSGGGTRSTVAAVGWLDQHVAELSRRPPVGSFTANDYRRRIEAAGMVPPSLGNAHIRIKRIPGIKSDLFASEGKRSERYYWK